MLQLLVGGESMFIYNEDKFRVSKHCQERYAERIVGKSSKLDINTYIAKHEDKIRNDIAKMLLYGEKIYRGKALCGLTKNKEENTIILCGSWVIIYSEPKDLVITMYKIDFGVGEEFNKEYVRKALDMLRVVENRMQKADSNNEEERKAIEGEISKYEEKIERYTELVRDMQAHVDVLKQELETISCKGRELELKRTELISKLIGKKVQ